MLVVSLLLDKPAEKLLGFLQRIHDKEFLPRNVLWSEALLAILFYAVKVTPEVLAEFAKHNVYPRERCWRIYMAWIYNAEAILSAFQECGIVEKSLDELSKAYEKYRRMCALLPANGISQLFKHMVAPNDVYSNEVKSWLQHTEDYLPDRYVLYDHACNHNQRVRFERAQADGYECTLEEFREK